MTHMRRLVLALIVLTLIVLTAGCAQPPCPVCPPPKPPAERAQYVEWSYAALPGWSKAQLEPSLRAFMAGCPRSAGPFISACAAGSAVPEGDEAAARRFFETGFVPYALLGESGESGLVTGYYEPILPGSRTRDAVNRYPIYGVPDDLVVVDLASVSPE